MSTQAVRTNVHWLRMPQFLWRRPRITDGDLELRVTYELYNLLAPLPQASRDRALKHVREIFHEQATALNEYEFGD